MINFKVFTLILWFVSASFGTKENSNMCGKLKPISKFVARKVEDKWYAQEIMGQYPIKAKDCLFLNYKNNKMRLQNGNDKPIVLTMKQKAKTSKFNLKVKDFIVFPININLVILNAEIENFVVAYVCFGFQGSGLILTREKNPGNEVIEEARNILKENGFTVDNSTMTTINQAECKQE